MSREPLVVLSGPTASGKSALALALCRRFPLEIVNADSVQVYRGLDIGSAKPSPRDRAEVPHYLVDVADPGEGYSAGRFVREAQDAIRRIRRRDRVPLVVGGTGMYLRALLRGLDPLPSDPRVRDALRKRWDREGGEGLYRELARVDPATAERVHPADRVRVLRALEIAEAAGVPASALRSSWSSGGARFRLLFLALRVPDRDLLYRRIDDRVETMLREGLREEVRSLLARGYRPGQTALRALGYRHLLSHLVDGTPLARAVEEMKRDTRRYAKRQLTWLSSEPGVVWIDAGAEAEEEAAALVGRFLS